MKSIHEFYLSLKRGDLYTDRNRLYIFISYTRPTGPGHQLYQLQDINVRTGEPSAIWIDEPEDSCKGVRKI